jgi:hypothetical protein
MEHDVGVQHLVDEGSSEQKLCSAFAIVDRDAHERLAVAKTSECAFCASVWTKRLEVHFNVIPEISGEEHLIHDLDCQAES